jgi:adenine-specific DNA methylase
MTKKSKSTSNNPGLLINRNPDVLNSLANLSNDEVFTTPELANKMLDDLEKSWADQNSGEFIWSNSSLKFLDPFTKSGVFLREITKRLIDGLEGKIPDLQKRVDHILGKQIFGEATTNLTALVARRSVYCSKLANGEHSIASVFADESGNIKFTTGKHKWSKAKVPQNKDESESKSKCELCGAPKGAFNRESGLEVHAYNLIHTPDVNEWTKETFGEEMQFDVIIGNPPYQLEDGGFKASASPIYHKFVEQALSLKPKTLVMVIPARWYAGGKGLDKFREMMINNKNIKVLVDYPDATKVFPGAEIKGGVCYFLWDSQHNDVAEIRTQISSELELASRRFLKADGFDVFIRYPQGVAILEKVVEASGGPNSFTSFSSLVSSRKPFGLPTNFRGKAKKQPGDITLFENGGQSFVALNNIKIGKDLIAKSKILVSKAYGAGNGFPHQIIGLPFIAPGQSACTETYLAIGPFDTAEQSENALSYMKSKLFRFLVLLHKPTQDASRAVYSLVPNQDFSEKWDDAKLYKKYKLNKEEIDFIESMVRPMGDE